MDILELKLLTHEQIENEVSFSYSQNFGCAETATEWRENEKDEEEIVRSETTELLNRQVLILLDILKSKYGTQDDIMQEIVDRISNSYHIDNLIIYDMLAGRTEYIYSLNNE